MGIDLIIYRARVGLHYRRHLNLKGLKPFTDFESILFLNDILHMSFLAGTHVFKAFPAYTTTEL